LRSIAPSVTPGSVKPADGALHLAFTSAGLTKLGLDAEGLATFSAEFVSGMTTPHRRRLLGDAAESAPENWLWGGPATAPVDLLLMLFARDRATLASACTSVSGTLPGAGLREILRLETSDLDDREHFGFRDGIAQPIIPEFRKSGPAANTVRAGEFVLGYENEYGLMPETPSVPRTGDAAAKLPAAMDDKDRSDLGRNGSYLVMRQLSQDVRGFWRYVDGATKASDGTPDPGGRTRLAAKMVGRWPDGAPLALSPDHHDPALGNANEFGYHELDADGLRCPYGAHIRRTNPRDSLDPKPGTDESLAANKRHRLLRRGREYGPPLSEEQIWRDPAPGEAEVDRGLYFICLNADIGRQFEFVSHTWMNNPNFAGLYDDPDPLTGPSRNSGCSFTVQATPFRHRYAGLPRFVTVRGGGYFFLPGLRAIRYLAGLDGGA
jgi:Dyp-type peroxidase family